LLLSGKDFLVGTPSAFGKFIVHDYAERVLGDEGRNTSHVSAELAKRSHSLFVRQFFNVVSFRSATECAAQAVERKVTPGQNFSARLKIAERKKH
jgi:hypothetical protein